MGTFILLVSIIVQFTAAGLAIKFLRRTGYRIAWGTVVIALALMGVRRSTTFWKAVSGQDPRVLDSSTEFIALVISFLMLTGVVQIGRMFDEEKKKSKNLDSARNLLRQTIDAAPLVISIKDADQRYIFANRYLANRHDLEPEDFEERTLEEALGKTRETAFVRQTTDTDLRVISTGKAIPFFEETITINGSSRHLLTSKTPLFDDGNVSYVLTVALDITANKEVEESLRLSEEQRELAVDRLQNAITIMSDGFVLYDAQGRLEFFNDSFRKLNRYDKEDLVPGVTTYDDLGVLDEERSRNNRQLLSFDQRRAQLRRDGPMVVVQKVGDEVYERHQSLTPEGGIIGVSTDITDLKETEREMNKAREDAEQANAAKSTFLASMSHELRTPLNAILGFTQMLALDFENTLTLKQKMYLEDVQRGGNHLLGLVNDLLDLATIEANKTRLDLQTVDAVKVARECMSLVEPLCKTRDIEITNNVSNRSPTYIQIDEKRLRQVFLNLVSNAVRYNRDSGKITIDGVESSNGFFRFSVTDTGQGIPDHDKTNVFHLFHQAGNVPDVATEGTGIGLYVSKLLVERMGGKIGFESTEGVGSTFWFETPLASHPSQV